MKKQRVFKSLSDRDHILLRPNMTIGATDETSVFDYILKDEKFSYEEIKYVPGLVKIINEIIDNSVDEAIRTNFEFGNLIKVNFNSDTNFIEVEDNGRGIPVELNDDGIYMPILCWGQARAGENFESDDSGRDTIGMNGIGSYATNVFSLQFIGETSDGHNKLNVKFVDNAESYEISTRKSTTKYTKVQFQPDLKRFGLTEQDVFSDDSIYKKIIYQRLLNLSICYPKIIFHFNKKAIKVSSPKNILAQFGDNFEFYSNDKYMFAIYSNESDDFRFYSYINGLKLPNGGQHIDLISNEITSIIRDKLSKKYKTIKPGEIKNKLFVVFYGSNFLNPKFDSQTKEKLTNSIKEVRDYLGDLDLQKIAAKILKNNSIIDPIIETYRIKEELKKRQEINSLNKKKKKITDEKYMPPTDNIFKYLVLAEGESAAGGISAVLGREGIGYYELKGIPLNAYEKKTLDVLTNKEIRVLIELLDLDINLEKEKDSKNWYLYNDTIVNENDEIMIDDYFYRVIDLKDKVLIDSVDMNKYKHQKNVRRKLAKKSISYENILLGTDQDLDGVHIRGLLLALFLRYAPNLIEEGRLKILKTPLLILRKGSNIEKIFFDFDEYNLFINNNDISKYTVQYMKGLGSWEQEDLMKLFKKYGFDYFIETFEWCEETYKYVHQWMSGSESDSRKDLLQNNEFDIFKI